MLEENEEFQGELKKTIKFLSWNSCTRTSWTSGTVELLRFLLDQHRIDIAQQSGSVHFVTAVDLDLEKDRVVK